MFYLISSGAGGSQLYICLAYVHNHCCRSEAGEDDTSALHIVLQPANCKHCATRTLVRSSMPSVHSLCTSCMYTQNWSTELLCPHNVAKEHSFNHLINWQRQLFKSSSLTNARFVLRSLQLIRNIIVYAVISNAEILLAQLTILFYIFSARYVSRNTKPLVIVAANTANCSNILNVHSTSHNTSLNNSWDDTAPFSCRLEPISTVLRVFSCLLDAETGQTVSLFC